MANKSLFKSLKSLLPRADARNEAGAPAYKLPPKQALAQIAATGCFNGTFYAQATAQLDAVRALVEADPFSRPRERDRIDVILIFTGPEFIVGELDVTIEVKRMKIPFRILKHHVGDLMARQSQAGPIGRDLIAEQALLGEDIVELVGDGEMIRARRLN